MSIEPRVVAEGYRGMADKVKRGAIGDYMPFFGTEKIVDGVRYPDEHRWLGDVLCRECKMEYHKGHDPDCSVGHKEGVGRLY